MGTSSPTGKKNLQSAADQPKKKYYFDHELFVGYFFFFWEGNRWKYDDWFKSFSDMSHLIDKS